jgi:hypothetical protein
MIDFTARYFAKNSVTGLYFDGRTWESSSPAKSFDAVEIAFIKATWANVVMEPLTEEQQAAEEGWSLEWFR